MKLVFLLTLKERVGGGSYSVFKFAESLAENGHDVNVFYLGNSKITSKKQIPSFKVYKKFNVEFDFKGRGLINIILNEVYDRLYLNRYLKKNHSNIDYIVGYQRELAIKAVHLGRKFRIKTANFTFETPEWLMEKWPEWKNYYNNDKRLRESWVNFKNALIFSDIIIANSKICFERTSQWIGKTPDLVLYPGISLQDINSFEIIKQRQIIYVGRIEGNKNIDDIIKAMAFGQFNIKLVICGRGSSERALKKLARDLKVDVVFKGSVSEKEKWEEINKSILMVFPSSFEGFGMPPMEALIQKVPCICSDIPILKEVYDNSVEYFEEHNIYGLAEKIRMMVTDQDYAKKRGEYGYQYVLDKFGWDKSALKLEQKLFEFRNRNDLIES